MLSDGWIKETRLYRRLRCWHINRLYRRKHPGFRRELEFYRSLEISGDRLVFDLGANKGYKTDVFLDLGARVLAVEPDIHSFKELMSRFGTRGKVILLNEAVSDKEGTEEFFVFHEGGVLNTLNDKWRNCVENPVTGRFEAPRPLRTSYLVKTQTLDDLIRTYGMPYYVKLDVEGSEWNAVKGLSAPVPLLSFEANLPELREETLLCLQKLHSLSSRYLFNEDNEQFSFRKDWIPYKEMRRFITDTELLYCEIYARLK